MKLTGDSGVDYGADIERLKDKLVELEAERDDAVGRIEHANGLEIVLADRLKALRGHSKRGTSKGGPATRSAALSSSQDEKSGDEIVTIRSSRKSYLQKTLISRGLLVAASLLVLLAAVAGIVQLKSGLKREAVAENPKPLASVPASESNFKVDYRSIGTRGTVEVIVIPENADIGSLSNQMNVDFKGRSRVQVYAFDDASAAEYLLKTYGVDFSGYTSDQLAAEYAKYYPHWKATYFRDINNRLNQVEVYQDDQHLTSKIIRLPLPVN